MTDSYTALFASDIHMSNELPHAKPSEDGRTDRLDDQIKLWSRFYRVASKYGAEDFWLLGDVFDKPRLDALTLTYTTRVLYQSPVPVRLLPGNHDAHTIEGHRFTLEAYGQLPAADVHYHGGRPPQPFCPKPWLVFWPVEFMNFEATRATLHDIQEQIKDGLPDTWGERMDVLLFHNSILGCTHSGWLCDIGMSADEVCEGFDFVISGHFHDTQMFGDGRGMYLGAPMHHRFDDAGRKAGIWLMEFHEGGEITRSFYNGKAPRFHEVDWGTEPEETINSGDYLRYKVSATHAEWAKLRSAVEVAVADVQRRHGVRASFRHVPVYHHEARIESHGDMAMAGAATNVSAYVDASDVDTSGLSLKRLREIGAQALEASRRAK